jgi:hypothetical protein
MRFDQTLPKLLLCRAHGNDDSLVAARYLLETRRRTGQQLTTLVRAQTGESFSQVHGTFAELPLAPWPA